MTEPPRTIYRPRKIERSSTWHGENDALSVPVSHFVNDEYILRSEYDKDLQASRQLYDAARAEVRELREVITHIKLVLGVLVP